MILQHLPNDIIEKILLFIPYSDLNTILIVLHAHFKCSRQIMFYFSSQRLRKKQIPFQHNIKHCLVANCRKEPMQFVRWHGLLRAKSTFSMYCIEHTDPENCKNALMMSIGNDRYDLIW